MSILNQQNGFVIKPISTTREKPKELTYNRKGKRGKGKDRRSQDG